MAYGVVFASEAGAQLVSIYNYIAREANPDIALAFGIDRRLLRKLHDIPAQGHTAGRSPARPAHNRLS